MMMMVKMMMIDEKYLSVLILDSTLDKNNITELGQQFYVHKENMRHVGHNLITECVPLTPNQQNKANPHTVKP